MQEIRHFDLVVIGSGPAGEAAAMQASKLKKRVALVERLDRLGGASLHTGTVPSKSLRETVVNLAMIRQQSHGIQIAFKENLTTAELMFRKQHVISEQESSLRRNLDKNRVAVMHGTPQFLNPNLLEITPDEGEDAYQISMDYVVLMQILQTVAQLAHVIHAMHVCI